MKEIVITKQIPCVAEQLLKDTGYRVSVPSSEGLTYEEIKSKAHNCYGLITMLSDKIDRELINSIPKLKVISNFAVGFNNIDTTTAKDNSIIVTNTPDVLTDATAELALTLLMATSRRLKEAQEFIAQDKWKKWETMELLGPSLKGKTLGILGMGRIGESFAHKCEAALGMKVIYHNRNNKNNKYQYVNFEELISSSDVLSVHCPLTKDTDGIINETVFDKMKDTSILINTSRGEICKTDDLLRAIKRKQIFAAGLDVTSPEPLDFNHELYKQSNVIITPHIGSATIETRDSMAKLCAENIIAVLEGRPAITPV